MAFALGTSAGAGTISIPAGGRVVTGVGTAFSSGNVGAILVVGSQWGVIATFTSTTSVTLDRPVETVVSGAAYTVSANYPIITQSGTDTSLSALATLPGVANLNLGNATIYNPVNTQLNVTGTLSFDGLTEKLVYNNQTDTAVGGTQRDNDIRVSGTLTVNLSSVVNGVTIYAPDFVYFSRRPAPSGGGGEHQINTTGSSFYIISTGTANLTGGTYAIRHNFACQSGGRFNVVGSHLKGNGSRFWMQNGSITTFSNCTIENFSIFFNSFPTTLSGVTFRNCGTITKEVTHSAGFDAAPNVILAPQWQATANPIVNIWGGSWLRVKNASAGSSLGVLDTATTPWASGIYDYVQDVSFTTRDLAGAGVVGFKFYAAESNDGNRRNVRQYTGVGPFYDNTDVRTMLFTTATGGVSNTIEMRLRAGVTTLTPTSTPGSGGLVTTNFGQTTSDEYDFFGIGYIYNLSQNRIQCRAQGPQSIATVALPDLSITQSNMTTVSAYTSLDTAQQLYDFAKYHLYTNFAGQSATYITRSGNVIAAGSLNFIINQSAASVLTPSGSSIAIKSANFTGSITTSGSVILANGSVVSNNTVSAPNVIQDVPTSLTGVTMTGNLTYNTNTPITITLTDCNIAGTISNTGSAQVNVVKVNTTIGTVGTNVVAQQFATVSAPNLISGTRVRVYDVDNSVELYNGVLASAGFYQSFVYEADTTITLTATYVSGATAKLGVSATGVLTASGVTFLNSQVNDTIYNAIAVNGSAVTGFAADYVNDEINVTVAANFNVTNLYAWWVYNQSTTQGIADFFGGITAVDAANFRIENSLVDLYIDNTTATNIRQLDNARIYRADNAYPVKSSGGGGIDVNWRDQVYLAPSVDYSNLATQASLNLVKAKTDNLPANTATQLDAIQQKASLAASLSA